METYYVLALVLEDLALAVWLLCIGVWLARAGLARRRGTAVPLMNWWVATILPAVVLVGAAGRLGAGVALGRHWWPLIFDTIVFVVITGVLTGLTLWRRYYVRAIARHEATIARYEAAKQKLRDGDVAGAQAALAEAREVRRPRWRIS